ncbi:M56 family metallopeptidase [Flavilitoribacter nigricans]|uniref:Peptidase M56 domain-containing protein n=1 Tax=Flavilitoribacter nigricans (strain ATCC 23147 / DSM 23189 / NBRC 102662 / NCIMB 1420 / SS-2) TaxID=1122177 RepID=A0A2D0NJ87_FLAN2|nr:M56 family metallopeptidase [Flavilitoribacter nigricans]PHN08426.1 hypothetical protein CRP01_00500 [Flavilitoribacter nigricans DSM 23189 = NBRC 102662]
MSLTQYLLEFSICLALFYALYHWLLRKETFFQLNRWYLLLSPVLSMIIPFLDWQLPAEPSQSNWDQIVVPLVTDLQEQQLMIWENLGRPATATASFTYLDLLVVIYLMGMLWMAGRLLYRTWRLMKLIGLSEQKQESGYTVVRTAEKIPAASFLSYVFWEEGPLSPERKSILEHELVHVRQWHSLDVLLMEVWVMLKWFHPIIYWYRNSLRLTHEYIADAYVSDAAGSRLEYAQLLTNTKAPVPAHQLLHHFNSSIKMRLLMLAKHQSSKWKYLKILSILPVTAVLMMLFAFNLSGELPDPLVEPLEKIERGIQDIAQRPVLPPETTETLPAMAKNYTLKWGEIECACRNEQFPNYYHCENQSLRPRELKRLIRKEGGFQVFLEDQPQSITELKAVSKYMKDMGGYQGQFDEMEQSFNTESPLWDQAEKGDVFRFTFSNGGGDYFEFDVVMNNRREDFVFGSLVELGDYQFNINLTNDVGVVHMDVEELKKLAQSPLRVLKNNDAYYSLASARVTNQQALRDDHYKRVRGEALDISKANAILEAFPGDRVHFALESEAGETIKFDVMLREKSSWDGRKRELGFFWGDRYFETRQMIMLSKAELEEMKAEEMYLYANGRKHRMEDVALEENVFIAFRDGKPEIDKKRVSSTKELIELRLPKLEPGDALSLGQMKSVKGYLSPYIFVRIDYDWKEVFADNPNARVLPGNKLVIEPARQEDLKKIFDLTGFRNIFYKIQVDNKVYELDQMDKVEGKTIMLEKDGELPPVKNKIIVSRVECLNCKK